MTATVPDMEWEFEGEIFYWRGPAPFYFIAVADEASEDLQEMSGELSYGWGVIPVRATIAATTWTTSLFPKNGGYLLPVKAMVRRAEDLEEGDLVTTVMQVDGPP